MVDFATIQGIRGPKLSDLAQHVSDVLALNLAEDDEFQVGRLILAEYAFVPFALTGLSAAMRTPAPGATRATTTVTVPLGDDVGGSATVQRDVTLFGPGDVIGVDPGQIIRRYPSPGSTNAEETFHAHVEFDRPELPWAFSAHTPGDTMPPWLTLVVLEPDELEWEPSQAGFLPVMSAPADTLPDLSQAWAWAHAQAPGGSASLSARLSTAYSQVNVSRLLAARILTQHTNYVACLVPTTEVGRNAGLGLTGGTLGPAWTLQSGTVRLPVYDRWEFRTGPDGDFARLARRLVGVAAPWAIGRRFMDASVPGLPFGPLADAEPGRRQVIKCALFSPAPPPPGAPDETARWSTARIDQLRTALERPAVVEGTAVTAPGAPPDLPIIGPRLYARGQRGVGTVPAGDWFETLNLTPVHRVVAGLGTRVVIKDQEPLMQAAWAQVGEIDAANRALMLAELSRNLATSLHRRLTLVDDGRLLQMVRPLADRTKLAGANLTIAGQVTRTSLPAAALSSSMRRALRPSGPIARRLAPAERTSVVRVVAEAGGLARDFRRPYQELDGIGGLSALAIESLDPAIVGSVLGLAPDAAVKSLMQLNTRLARGASLATITTTPTMWGDPDVSFEPGRHLADLISHRLLDDAPLTAADDIVKARSRAGLLAGLAVADVKTELDTTAAVLRLESGIAEFTNASVVTETPAPTVRSDVRRAGRNEMFRAHAARVNPLESGVRPTGDLHPIEAGLRLGLSDLAAGSILGSIGRPERTIPLIGGPVIGGPVIGGPVIGGPVIGGPVVGGPVVGGPVVGGPVIAGPVIPERERIDKIRSAHGTLLANWLDAASAISVAGLRDSVMASIDFGGTLDLAPTPSLDPFTATRGDLLARLTPQRTVVDSIRGRLSLGPLAFDPFVEVIRPIMAAPRFDRPMYEALDNYDREWLVPGLGALPEPEMVTLLSANDQFTEAFLIGLSDEMGRELLWRQYPTDARGTYFHRFWNADEDELTEPIHRFSRTELGRHVSIGSPLESGRAVVVIRGEIVRRYPDMTVMALREQGRDREGRPLLPENPRGPAEAARTMFLAMLPPDVMLCGLDITVDELRTAGWWIVLAENPQGTRFRRGERDLNGHEIAFARPGTAAHGAAVAADRLENPTRIAFEAGDFLPAGS